MNLDNRMPHVIIIAGPNGAGKSTTAPAILNDALGVTEFVNADTIALGLSAFNSEKAAFHAGRLVPFLLTILTLVSFGYPLKVQLPPTAGLSPSPHPHMTFYFQNLDKSSFLRFTTIDSA